MIQRLIQWSVNSPIIVICMTLGLAGIGAYSFLHVNVEAYPDPAPAIIEVIGQFPGASAEEIERRVTIPLEVTLAGMPGLKYTRSKSLVGLAHLRNQFEYGVEFKDARQEVINRLQFTEALPTGVTPQLSPTTPTGEIYRYTLNGPKDALGREIYTLNDLKALQDWALEREFRRIPRIADVTSSGGTVKRYEVHPEPDRLRRYGVTLAQLQNAISNANVNAGGDHLSLGQNVLNIRGIGLLGGGLDPMAAAEVFTAPDPAHAAMYLRIQEDKRLQEVRRLVVAAINNHPIRVEELIEGGPIRYAADLGKQGAVVGFQPRLGRVGMSKPKLDASGKPVLDKDGHEIWTDEDDKVQGIVLLRKNESTLPALEDVKKKVADLNARPGRLLPGVKIETYYDRADLIAVTTETVHENLLTGMTLVTIILLMFLSNVRSALIVALNVPLALMFAFSMLYLRGKSANLLSIGAVDFGIIVDSSVIMVENIYRHLSAGENAHLPLRERIVRASKEIQRGLFFSTVIMVCAFLPLFTMQGPEGQIFGPMADTYAFALGGGLLLALTIAPVLCLLLFRNLKPSKDNFMVHWLRVSYISQLRWCLRHRTITVIGFLIMMAITLSLVPFLGREFMPELEEGNLWIRATFPVNITLESASEKTRLARSIMTKYPEVETIVSQTGRPDDGTDPTGFYNVEFFVPLRPTKNWPLVREETGWGKFLYGAKRIRTKMELVDEMNAELKRTIVGVDWNFSQNIRDNVMEALSGVKGDNSVKIFGPNLDELEKLAEKAQQVLGGIQGVTNVGIFRIMGQPNLEFPIDSEKCSRWGVSATDVQNVITTAVGGQPFSQMIEGEKRFDLTLRWPAPLRDSEAAILRIPVDVVNNQVTQSAVQSIASTRLTGASTGISSLGSSNAMPSLTGSQFGGTFNNMSSTPRRPLGDLVTPYHDPKDSKGEGSFVRSGASTIYREQGQRLIAVKFSVRGRDLGSAVAEARSKVDPNITAPYHIVWSGEFEEMQEAEARLMLIIPISLTLIFLLLYLAFHSVLDAMLIFSNVAALSMGGVWALYLTGTNFSVSAAVGFISIFGVAIMDGLLLVSYFNHHRSQGMPLEESIIAGGEKRVRPMMMTDLTAIFGLLPAAFSTRIGSQTQRPLAIVVVGGMISMLVLTRYLTPVLYSYYGHREPRHDSASMAH